MTTIRFEKDLSEFQSIVMLYRDEENNIYILETLHFMVEVFLKDNV